MGGVLKATDAITMAADYRLTKILFFRIRPSEIEPGMRRLSVRYTFRQ